MRAENPHKNQKPSSYDEGFIGAATRIRTGDLILTKDVLYQLSHSSAFVSTYDIITERRAFVKRKFYFLKNYFSSEKRAASPHISQSKSVLYRGFAAVKNTLRLRKCASAGRAPVQAHGANSEQKPQAFAPAYSALSRPVSRVLSGTVIYLDGALPRRSCHPRALWPGRPGAHTVLLRIGFTALLCCHRTG